MVIHSFIKDYFGLRPIQVEVVLTTGLPQISILGLPDAIIRESAKRIQTALVAQGYHMPRAKQVLVNLKPNEIKKTSLGIDLAIALGILWESGQRAVDAKDIYVYGELSLEGQVLAPKDILNIPSLDRPILTGQGSDSYPFTTKILSSLRGEVVDGKKVSSTFNFSRPSLKKILFPEKVAEYLKIIAVGEHSALLAGPAGSGKTTFVESVAPLLGSPTIEAVKDILRIGHYFNQKPLWRPVVQPHHSSTAISLVGGGAPPRPGELVRSHRGVLVLDEILEFDPKVQSMLREPIEQKKISLSKGAYHREFPCDFLLLGTTNLCKCGDFVPDKQNRCRCSGRQLRNYLEKLTGPFVDRFDILLLTHKWHRQDIQGSEIGLKDILFECENARKFISEKRSPKKINSQLSTEEIIQTFESQTLENLLPAFRSRRRKLSFLRVLRTIADIDLSEKINQKHFQQAQEMAYVNFCLMRDNITF